MHWTSKWIELESPACSGFEAITIVLSSLSNRNFLAIRLEVEHGFELGARRNAAWPLS